MLNFLGESDVDGDYLIYIANFQGESVILALEMGNLPIDLFPQAGADVDGGSPVYIAIYQGERDSGAGNGKTLV